MKICHISTGFPISFQGGITNYVRSLASMQEKMGHEVWVICGLDDQKQNFHVKEYKSEKIVPMKLRKPIDKYALSLIDNFLKNMRFDIIHIHMVLDIDWDLYQIMETYNYVVSLHDYFFLCPRIQMIMNDYTLCTSYNESKCKKCISWFNVHRVFNGIEYKISHKTKWKDFRFPLIPQQMTANRYKKYKFLLENSKMLLPVSNRVQEIYEDSGIQGKYKVLHIGNISANNYKAEFKFDWNKDKICLTMLGNLSYLKGADLLIELANILDRNKIEINFYGRSGKYAEMIKKAGISDHGSYNQAELSEILENTDVGLVLSVWEDNGPQVVMEFLNNHIPVIGTRMGGIPDFIEDGVNGILFNPYSEDELFDTVKKISNWSRKDIFDMKKRIVKTITVEEHCKLLQEIYDEIVGGN